MTFCSFCGDPISKFPFICNYCGESFCSNHRLPENHQCSFDFKKDSLKPINKEIKKGKDVKYGRGKGSYLNGTNLLFLFIISISILGHFFPEYLCITSRTLYQKYFWTILSSFFVIFAENIHELFYFIVLMVLSYKYIRAIEKEFGMFVVLKAFILTAVLTGLINLVLDIAWQENVESMYPLYPDDLLFFVTPSIGLASGTLLGLITFYFMKHKFKKKIMIKDYKIKGIYLLLFLVIFNIISKIFSAMIVASNSSIPYHEPEYSGILFLWILFDSWGFCGGVFASAAKRTENALFK
ncbi:MAG: AN1-type zinc finger domain-containing protein [Promethearchaeota archaeon]